MSYTSRKSSIRKLADQLAPVRNKWIARNPFYYGGNLRVPPYDFPGSLLLTSGITRGDTGTDFHDDEALRGVDGDQKRDPLIIWSTEFGKKAKVFREVIWEVRSCGAVLLPLDKVGDKLWDFRS